MRCGGNLRAIVSLAAFVVLVATTTCPAQCLSGPVSAEAGPCHDDGRPARDHAALEIRCCPSALGSKGAGDFTGIVPTLTLERISDTSFLPISVRPPKGVRLLPSREHSPPDLYLRTRALLI